MKRALALVLSLIGCDPAPAAHPERPFDPGPKSDDPRVVARPPRPAPLPDEAVATLVVANNTFAANLYAQLRAREGNLALSPASIALALGMTYAGARGETADEMRRVLALEPLPDPHAAHGTLLRSWQLDPKMPFVLTVASSLFADEGFALRPELVGLTEGYYMAPVERVPFRTAPDEARRHINGWVRERTMKKIEELLPPGSIESTTRLVIANAVYFSGTWAATFDESATREAPFFAPSGELSVPTMHRKASYDYAEIDGAKLLEMPYRGGRWAMTIVLPDARDGLPALEARFTQQALAGWLERLARTEVRVALPRFTIDPPQPLALSEALSALGMPTAFDPRRADLGGMAEPSPGQNLFVSQVFHRAFVEVNERGTEAAAATGVAVSVTSLPLPAPEPKAFVADHPFLFFIRDLESQSLMFVGRLVSPR